MLAVAVDNIAFSSNLSHLMQKFKSKLSATFSVKLFGQLKSSVRWPINITDYFIKVDQRNHFRKLLQEHVMKSALVVQKPLPVSADITYRKEYEEHLSSSQHYSYRSITVGIL